MRIRPMLGITNLFANPAEPYQGLLELPIRIQVKLVESLDRVADLLDLVSEPEGSCPAEWCKSVALYAAPGG